uniref:colony stimulating factor 3 (granulocyte) b isoform X2 n=1 Tax=Monopterus albus TaxID=43700 RepID=UPI0009B34DB6|nr:granulocyte colony-stimulating factor-like isoform X2 [Monopterus albus]
MNPLRVLVQSASISSPTNLSLMFREAVEQTKMLVEKILKDLPTVHAAAVTIEGLTLNPPSQTINLEMMAMSLGIPAAPVIKPLSERFTLDICVSRMLAGTRLYQGLLGVLSDKVDGLDDLKVDLRDLLLRISKMKEAAQLEGGDSLDQNSRLDLASRLPGNYEVQVAVHLTVSQLRSFCHDLIRSLRTIATYRP